jgi:hypothetical protein
MDIRVERLRRSWLSILANVLPEIVCDISDPAALYRLLRLSMTSTATRGHPCH